MDIRVAIDAATAGADGAKWIANQLRNAVHRRDSASLAVSGGTTPAQMFTELAKLDVPWTAVTVWQVDERIVPEGSAERNARLLAIFDEIGADTRPMPVDGRDLNLAARRYAEELPARFDVVHLGIGDDGHTASWAPGDPVADQSAAVAISGEYRGSQRMTLTPPIVNGARHRLVFAIGAEKAAPIRGWLLHNEALPIERLHRTGTVVILDTPAASLLPLANPSSRE